jgi:2,3-bisphosphoglycerate-independent phosphoglycerate mutase
VRVALLFIDGVGIGARDTSKNPLARAEYLMSHFDDGSGSTLPHGGRFKAVDPTFGVEGRPQSASNQTSLLTGQPAPKLLGQHLMGYPDEDLRAIITEHSIVKALIARGRTAAFANAYPAGFLDHLQLERMPSATSDLPGPLPSSRRIGASAGPLAFAAGGVPIRTFDDVRRGKGLTHDIDGRLAQQRFKDLPLRTPEEAAGVFWALARDFTHFEHYLADEAGHHRDAAFAEAALSTFDAFARAVIAQRPADAQVLVTSDHGNVEDLSTRSHTRNFVPLLAFGPASHTIDTVETLAQVGQLVLRLLE